MHTFIGRFETLHQFLTSTISFRESSISGSSLKMMTNLFLFIVYIQLERVQLVFVRYFKL